MGGALLIRRSWLQRRVMLHDQRSPYVPLEDKGIAGSQRRAAAAIQFETVEPGRESVAADPANNGLVERDDRPVLEEALEIVGDRFGLGLVGERPVRAGRQQDRVFPVVGPNDRGRIVRRRSGQLLFPIVQPFVDPTIHIARVPRGSRPSLGRARRNSEDNKRGRQKAVHGMAPRSLRVTRSAEMISTIDCV